MQYSILKFAEESLSKIHLLSKKNHKK